MIGEVQLSLSLSLCHPPVREALLTSFVGSHFLRDAGGKDICVIQDRQPLWSSFRFPRTSSFQTFFLLPTRKPDPVVPSPPQSLHYLKTTVMKTLNPRIVLNLQQSCIVWSFHIPPHPAPPIVKALNYHNVFVPAKQK